MPEKPNNNKINLEYLGVLCLGIFISSVIMTGIIQIADIDKIMTAVTTIGGTVISSAVALFLATKGGSSFKSENKGNIIAMFSIGLLLAFLWCQINSFLSNFHVSNFYNNGNVVITFLLIASTMWLSIIAINKVYSGESKKNN